MRRWAAVMMAAFLMAACGSSTDSAGGGGLPVITIVRVEITDRNATLTYTAFDAGNELVITVDWGDGAVLQGFTGQGEQTAVHVYTGDVTTAVVTVTGTDSDGNVGSDSASVDLLGANTSTSTEPPASSAPVTTVPTDTSTTSTTTTAPPAPAPTAAPTTTAPPPTTTEPPPEPIVIQLELDDATITSTDNERWSTSFQRDADRLAVYASTAGIGNDPVIAAITATWTIPGEQFAGLGPDPLMSVLFETRSDVRLCADDDNVRAALRLNATGSANGTEIGTAAAPVLQHADAAGGRCEDYAPERATLGFGGPVGDGDDVVIAFTARCEAIQPGLAIADNADCRGTRSQQATVELREARVTFRPNE